MSESTVIDTWLDDLLKNDSGIAAAFGDYPVAVFDGKAPHSQDYPFIVWQSQSMLDTVGIGPRARVMATGVYVIRVIARVSTYRAPILTSIAKAIDNAVDGATGITDDGLVLGARRDSEYRSTEDADGRQIRHLGGSYTIWATAQR